VLYFYRAERRKTEKQLLFSQLFETTKQTQVVVTSC